MAEPRVNVFLALIDKFSEPLEGVRGSLFKFGDVVKDLGKVLLGAFAVEKVFEFFKGSIEESLEATKNLTKFRLTVQNAGDDFESFKPKADAVTDSLAELGRGTKDQLEAALSRLISITGDTTQSLKEMGLVTDLAAFSGKSLEESATLVGQVMQGNVKPLREFGIAATTSKDGLAQLAEITRGFAESELNTLGGQLGRAKDAWSEFKEAVGNALLGSVDAKDAAKTLADVLVALGTAVEYAALPIRGLYQVLSTLADGAVATFSTIGQVIKTELGAVLEVLGTFGTVAKSFLKKVGIDLGEGMAETMKETGRRFREEGTAEIVANFKASSQQLKETWAGTDADLTETTKRGASTRRKLSADENATLVAIAEGGREHLTAAQRKTLEVLLAELRQYHGSTLRLTKEQLTALEAEQKHAETEQVASDKKRVDALAKIDKLANESAADLVSEHYKAMQELTAKFNEAMVGLRGEDLEKAKSQLAQAQTELLEKWAGFNRVLLPAILEPTETFGGALDGLGDRFTAIEPAVLTADSVIDGFTVAQLAAKERSTLLKRSIIDLADSLISMGDVVSTAAHNLESLIGADAVSQIDELVGAVQGLGSAAASIASGDIIGGVTQGVGALVSLGKTIFGSSDALAKNLAANNGRLAELRSTMGDLIASNAPGRELVGAQKALTKVLADPNFGFDKRSQQKLATTLVGQGLTIDDLDKLAESLQLKIRDDNGQIQAPLLRQLLEAIGTLDTNFAQTFAGQRQRIGEGVRLGAITDELTQAVEAATSADTGSAAIANALKGIDLGTTSGRADAITALQDLFTNIGSVSLEGLGNLSRTEFSDALQWLVDLLGKAGEPVPADSVAAAITSATEPAPDGSVAPGDGPAAGPADVSTVPIAPSWADALAQQWVEPTDLLRRIAAATEASALATAAPVAGRSITIGTITLAPAAVPTGADPAAVGRVQAEAFARYVDNYLASERNFSARATGATPQ